MKRRDPRPVVRRAREVGRRLRRVAEVMRRCLR